MGGRFGRAWCQGGRITVFGFSAGVRGLISWSRGSLRVAWFEGPVDVLWWTGIPLHARLYLSWSYTLAAIWSIDTFAPCLIVSIAYMIVV